MLGDYISVNASGTKSRKMVSFNSPLLLERKIGVSAGHSSTKTWRHKQHGGRK